VERNPVIEASPERDWAGNSEQPAFANRELRAVATTYGDRDVVDGDLLLPECTLEVVESVEEMLRTFAKQRRGVLTLEKPTCLRDSPFDLDLIVERSAVLDRWRFVEK
jgi:hypothetical protein